MATHQAHPRVDRLDTLSGIRRELSKLYRQTRRNQIPIEDLTKYASVLRIIAEFVVVESLEQKVGELEQHRSGIGLREIRQLKRAAA